MNVQQLLVNRRLYAALAGLAIIFLTYAVTRTEKPATLSQNDEMRSIPVGASLDKDSDRDGVRDWEEALWNTDPNDPDTYKNGIGDQAEIEKLRAEMTPEALDEELLTETGAFSRQLFASLASLNQSGELGEETLDSLAREISKNLSSQIQTRVYLQSDLKVAPTSTSSLEAYRKEIIRLAEKHKNDPLGSEITAMAAAADNGDKTKLAQAVKNAPIYEAAAKDYLAVTVPKILAPDHLQLVNGYAAVAGSLYRIEAMVDDPLIGFVEFYRYRNGIDRILVSYSQLIRYYGLRGTIAGTSTR